MIVSTTTLQYILVLQDSVTIRDEMDLVLSEQLKGTADFLTCILSCIYTQLCTLGSLQLTGYIENFQIEHKVYCYTF